MLVTADKTLHWLQLSGKVAFFGDDV